MAGRPVGRMWSEQGGDWEQRRQGTGAWGHSGGVWWAIARTLPFSLSEAGMYRRVLTIGVA